MRFIALAAVAAAIATPAAASAQDERRIALPGDEPVAPEMAQRLADPVFQEQMASTVAVLGEILLDLPVAPLAEAAAQMAGEDPQAVDPDMTLRNLAGPRADDVPQEIARELPRMMGAMAGMAEGLSAMVPALRDLARRVEDQAQEVAPAR